MTIHCLECGNVMLIETNSTEHGPVVCDKCTSNELKELTPGDLITVTVNGTKFHKASFLETCIQNGGHQTNKVEVQLKDNKFVDYFIKLYPLSKFNDI